MESQFSAFTNCLLLSMVLVVLKKQRKHSIFFKKKTVEAGFPRLHLQAILWGELPSTLEGVPRDPIETQSSTVEYFGFKNMTNYQWVHFIQPTGDYLTWGETAIKKWAKWDTTFKIYFCPHVSIGWDNNPQNPDIILDVVTNNKLEY
jgi:hypothetical protein